jgi:branched-chain amino acid transport system substrate-binding protein
LSTITRSALRIVAVAGAASVVVALSACTAPQASAPGITATEIRIGTHAPAAGPERDAANATKAYFDYVNSKGGVNGRKIVYDIEDDKGTQSGAANAVSKLVEKTGVFAIVGGTGTITHGAVAGYLAKRQVPDLFVESGSAQWDDPKTLPWTFGYGAGYVVESKVLATYAQSVGAVAPKCLLTEDGEIGDAFVSGIADTLGPSGLATTQRIAPGSDPSAQVASMRASGCTMVFLATSEPVTASVVTVAAAKNWTPTWLVASSGADYASLAADLGADAPKVLDGMLSTSVLPWGAGNRWATQFQVINEKYNPKATFDFDAALGMSVGYTFVEALTKAGPNPTRADIVSTLESGRVLGDGLMPITYSATNHIAYTGAGITQVKSGAQDYLGHAYLAAAGGSQAIEYVGKGIPFAGDGIPSAS